MYYIFPSAVRAAHVNRYWCIPLLNKTPGRPQVAGELDRKEDTGLGSYPFPGRQLAEMRRPTGTPLSQMLFASWTG